MKLFHICAHAPVWYGRFQGGNLVYAENTFLAKALTLGRENLIYDRVVASNTGKVKPEELSAEVWESLKHYPGDMVFNLRGVDGFSDEVDGIIIVDERHVDVL